MRMRHPLLAVAAGASVAVAALADGVSRHPTHLLLVALVAIAVVGVHASFRRSVAGSFRPVAIALVAQPALHVWAESVDPPHVHGHGLAYLVATDGTITVMQVFTSALAVLIAGACARIADILGRVIRRPADTLTPPVADRAVTTPAPPPVVALQSCRWRSAPRGAGRLSTGDPRPLSARACTSRHSRNRWAGEQIGRGRAAGEIVASTPKVIEGIPAARAAVELGGALRRRPAGLHPGRPGAEPRRVRARHHSRLMGREATRLEAELLAPEAGQASRAPGGRLRRAGRGRSRAAACGRSGSSSAPSGRRRTCRCTRRASSAAARAGCGSRPTSARAVVRQTNAPPTTGRTSTSSWRPSARSRPYRPASLNSSSTWFLVSTSTSAMSPTSPPMSGRLAGRLEIAANWAFTREVSRIRCSATGSRSSGWRRPADSMTSGAACTSALNSRSRASSSACLAQRDDPIVGNAQHEHARRRLPTAPAPAAFRSTLRSLSDAARVGLERAGDGDDVQVRRARATSRPARRR